MQLPKAVLDTSCLVALDAVGALPLLSFLFSCVLLPRAVREELLRRSDMEERLSTLFREFAFIAPCDEYDQVAVDTLFADRQVSGSKDRGEAEAIIQASQQG